MVEDAYVVVRSFINVTVFAAIEITDFMIRISLSERADEFGDVRWTERVVGRDKVAVFVLLFVAG